MKLEPGLGKADILTQLYKGFCAAGEEEMTEYMVYYSGHGYPDNGGWIV